MKSKKKLMAGLICAMAVIVIGTVAASATGEIKRMDSYAEIAVNFEWPENDALNPDKVYVGFEGVAEGYKGLDLYFSEKVLDEFVPVCAEEEWYLSVNGFEDDDKDKDYPALRDAYYLPGTEKAVEDIFPVSYNFKGLYVDDENGKKVPLNKFHYDCTNSVKSVDKKVKVGKEIYDYKSHKRKFSITCEDPTGMEKRVYGTLSWNDNSLRMPPREVVVKLNNGDSLTTSENKFWKYSFTVPEADNDRNLIEYFPEIEVPGFKCETEIVADMPGYLNVNFNLTPDGEILEDVSFNSAFTKVNDQVYKVTENGRQVNAIPIVKDKNGKILEKDKDYTVKYSSSTRKEPGKYSLVIKGINDYIGFVKRDVIITPEAVDGVKVRSSREKGGYDDAYVSWNKVNGASGYQVYARRPSKTSKWTYLGRTTKTNFLEKDLYDGWKYEFKVIPYVKRDDVRYRTTEDYSRVSMYTLKKVSTPSVKKYSSSKAKVTWKNISGESGYQISRSTSKTGTNIVSTYKTTKGTSKVVSASKNKGYYYKVRAYKVVLGEKVYAPWSSVKYYKVR